MCVVQFNLVRQAQGGEAVFIRPVGFAVIVVAEMVNPPWLKLGGNLYGLLSHRCETLAYTGFGLVVGAGLFANSRAGDVAPGGEVSAAAQYQGGGAFSG
jgi:hypothetical protein